MSRIAVMLIFILASSLALAAACGKRISAFNTFDQLEKGHLVDKHSVLPVTDWSNDSSYEGLLVAKSDEADTLRVQAVSAKSAALSAWNLDPNYRVASNLDMREFVRQKAKSYKVQLLKKGKVLCEDSYAILDSGEAEDGP